jgi:hypothetical protein
VHRDYSPKGVRFYYIYKSLAHPETNGYVQPFTLQERLRHVQEARRKLGSQVPWLYDSMANDLKHALGDAPNSEFVIAPDGKIARLRSWSNPKQLRKDLEELVGPVEKPTQVADLHLKTLPLAAKDAPQGVVPRLKVTGRMQAVKVQPVLGDTTFYVKLRAEADESALSSGKGQLYLGFLLDPLYHVHWNNLVEPLRYEIKTPAGMHVSPAAAQAPKVKQPADGDPREFLVKVEGGSSKEPIEVTVKYFACTEKTCEAVTQQYLIRLERDRDGGTVSRRSGFPGRGYDVLASALKDVKLTEQQKGPVEKIREIHQERMRKLFERMREGAIDFENMPSARQELQELLLKEMKWVLNEEQYKKFAQAMKNNRSGGFGGFGGFSGRTRNGDRPPSAPAKASPAPAARPKP